MESPDPERLRATVRSRAPFQDCRPFVIEDDPADRELMRQAFIRRGVPGANISVAKDGDEAVALLSVLGRARLESPLAELPSFVVLDLLLRRRPGLSVLEWIRSVPLLSNLPVMILTATDRPADVARARELGAASFYSKTLRFGDLLSTVETMLGRWRRLTETVGDPERMETEVNH